MASDVPLLGGPMVDESAQGDAPIAEPAPRCPWCGLSVTVPFVYGEPVPALVAKAERGEVVLGGCLVDPDLPLWRCTACGYEFGRLGDAEPASTSG